MKVPGPHADLTAHYRDLSATQQNDPDNGGSELGGSSTVESVDRRTVSLLRLLLASAALMITLVDPAVPDRLLGVTYLLLVGYCLYSLYLYFLVLRETYFLPVRFTHWMDVAWYSLFVAVSNGSNSIFFFFFFFAILIAAFRWGYTEGIYVTGVSVVLFITIGYLGSPTGDAFELNRFLIRPFYLSVFGYMIAAWGGRETVFKRRIALLREVSEFSNPRFGIDRTLQSILGKVRAFYEADLCLLITTPEDGTGFKIRSSLSSSDAGVQAGLTDEFASRIAELSKGYAVVFAGSAGRLLKGQQCLWIDPVTSRSAKGSDLDCSEIAELLRARNFLILPLYRHGELTGRLCVSSDRYQFDRSDVGFLRQLADQVLPSIENIQLLNRLASQAAEQERKKTSRDIHDSTIQPYIGLKLGLEAMELKSGTGQDVSEDIQKLIRLAESTISDLRGLAKDLSDGAAADSPSVLVTAVKQQALKYWEFYGINVDVEVADGLHLNDRLAAETFQIITEGLSNIRRHTESKNAVVRLSQRSQHLVLEIENANEGETAINGFVPKSISGRARALGGRATTAASDARTIVRVEIPL